MSPGNERSRPAGNGPAKESLDDDSAILSLATDYPAVKPRATHRVPSDFLRMLRPRAEFRRGERLARHEEVSS